MLQVFFHEIDAILSTNKSKCANRPFNPKRHGLFGQLNIWGGRILPILEKRSVTPFNFILEQQTVSHMKAEVFS